MLFIYHLPSNLRFLTLSWAAVALFIPSAPNRTMLSQRCSESPVSDSACSTSHLLAMSTAMALVTAFFAFTAVRRDGLVRGEGERLGGEFHSLKSCVHPYHQHVPLLADFFRRCISPLGDMILFSRNFIFAFNLLHLHCFFLSFSFCVSSFLGFHNCSMPKPFAVITTIFQCVT